MMNKNEVSEQIQEDILTYLEGFNWDVYDEIKSDLCQIVVHNFKKLED